MDHSGSGQSYADSYLRRHRSRASSGVSSTDGLFSALALVDSPRSVHLNISRPASSQGIHSASLISPAAPDPANFLQPSSTQSYSSTSVLSRNDSKSEWNEQGQSHDNPLVLVDPGQDNSPSPPTSRSSTITNMSAVAVQYDARFDMGLSRSSYTWPSLDSSTDLLGHDLGSMGHGSDASLTPPSTSRSVTASPPRGTLTPEQRELKRQRDQARRDSKTSVRARRALSTSYSSQSPPVTMAEFSTASALPIYSTSPSQISLLAEPVTMSGSSYVPSYSTSPLPDQGMFSAPFSTLPSSGYMGLDYSSGYPPPPPGQSLNAHYGGNRSNSMAEPGMLYSVPPALPSGNGSASEAGHVRVVQSRPKPQCWEHGCNGRQFSTFSNLLRHQREKSGQATKASCPNCGAEFTRTTARNGHLLHEKCKQRRNS
ncbi:hypothetical protein BJ170DRAFT_445488 [Xylariales sp. AK1849]|nr:hypothetical protein BJ170DRAFT_445488 [Xylariales sp. AK1849]